MKLVDDKGIVATFTPSRNGEYGFFATNDDAVIERMKAFKAMYGTTIKEVTDKNVNPHFNIHNEGTGGFAEISGMLNATKDDSPIAKKPPINPNDYIRYGELKASILRNSGEYRRDATDEQIKEYETLKLKLGV